VVAGIQKHGLYAFALSPGSEGKQASVCKPLRSDQASGSVTALSCSADMRLAEATSTVAGDIKVPQGAAWSDFASSHVASIVEQQKPMLSLWDINQVKNP
jgi:hypothetical protein